MTSPFTIYKRRFSINNSYDQEGTPSTNIPQHNNHHFRDSSADSSDSEFSTTPTTPTSTTPTIISMINNNNNNNSSSLPNLQRRASESIAETIQIRKVPARRYTISGRTSLFGLMYGNREDSSVDVARDQLQFGL